MSSGFGKIIGIRRRFPDGTKVYVTGSKTGLFIPADLADIGVLLITEGPADCDTALDLGFAVPSKFPKSDRHGSNGAKKLRRGTSLWVGGSTPSGGVHFL